MIRRIAYVSRAYQDLNDSQLQMLAKQASNRNATVGITGLLVFGGGWFMQVLEGPATGVELILNRILRDDRHHDIAVLIDDGTNERMFADWSMGVQNLDLADSSIREDMLDLVHNIRRAGARSRHSRATTMVLLREFQKLIRTSQDREVA